MQSLDPIQQAVSTARFLRATNALETDADNDAEVEDLLIAAQDLVETACRRPMQPRQFAFEVDLTGWSEWYFPIMPVVSVHLLQVIGADGVASDLPASAAILRGAGDAPRLIAAGGMPTSGTLRVVATCGHDVQTRPRQLAQAVILIAKEWRTAGITVEPMEFLNVSMGCRMLIRQVRYTRPAVTI